ncbi:hypothetical protein EYF80_017105 [Liparis tanakae]|uniref:Uncharacterized protein n=1 Tax=Liparis tanakae TaxID=230148 RepID=A0A4Z2I3K5_9TELE|nr:hypothetical protein EYF80_017105 [Liparis tanakae]
MPPGQAEPTLHLSLAEEDEVCKCLCIVVRVETEDFKSRGALAHCTVPEIDNEKVNLWQLEYQEMTFGPGDRLLYFPNHIHRVPKLQ